jgi:hypothetical protein
MPHLFIFVDISGKCKGFFGSDGESSISPVTSGGIHP